MALIVKINYISLFIDEDPVSGAILWGNSLTIIYNI